MTDSVEVADGVYQIETQEARIPGGMGFPRSSLVFFIPGLQSVLIETGPTSGISAVLDAVRGLGHDPSRLSYAIVTHVHMDHAGGSGRLASEIPGLQVVVHERGARHLIDPVRLVEATRLAFGERFEEDYGPILPVPEKQVCSVADGDTISLGDRRLRMVYAPGHAHHQMCVLDTKSGAIFSGEAVGSPGSPEVAAVAGFDMDSAVATVDRLGELPCRKILCSHGGSVADAASHIRAVRMNMKAYGDIMLAALRAGDSEQTIVRRLDDYHAEHAREARRDGQFQTMVASYVAYSKKKGIV